MTRRSLIACPHCAQLHQRIPIAKGASAACLRCGYVLYRQSALPLKGWLALTLAALIVFAMANYFPIATLAANGRQINATLPNALILTWQQGRPLVALMTGLFGFALPLTQLLFLFWAMHAIILQRLPADFHWGMRVLHVLSSWCMVPVLLLGILVAIVKLSGLAQVEPGPGLWAFGVLAVLLTALSRVTAQRLWRMAEDDGLVSQSGADVEPGRIVAACHSCGNVQSIASVSGSYSCGRCGANNYFRKPDSVSRTWAFVITAGVLYIPANILPVMRIRMPTGVTAHTILGGVIELWRLGSWDLALIVFVASVVVPMTKLFALAVLLMQRQWKGVAIARQRTRLYELVEFIGQWSMLDVFVVLLLSAMANFPGLSQVTAGPGAASFGIVVVLTMFAAMSYDPRQGWDADPGRESSGLQFCGRPMGLDQSLDNPATQAV
ncbi:MAG: paraquat-inducible protein A [Candidimonas sp.]|nr:MAG: paraquat-inducible protein A [Candidimonas sp.]TAM20305.1 MAG: paraquat-inducible protein A [Candidimonas sp.]TAM79910.1 MAG: paraquat-inducible protein A [Candidimonas sp.]